MTVEHTPGEKAIYDFLVIVQQFCELVEEHAGYPTYLFLRQVHLSLTQLYSQYLELPRPDFSLTTTQLTPDQVENKKVLWTKVSYSLQQKLGDEAKYTIPVGLVFEEIELLNCDLAEDLATIYCDLKLTFDEWHKKIGNDVRLCLYYRWWFWFWTHKGTLILQSISHLHRLFNECVNRPMDEGWQYLGGKWR